MAEAVEHEPQVEPAAPVAAGAGPAVATAGATSDLAGAGQSRPSLSRALVMRLQGSAGNAAVSGLVGGQTGPTDSERRPGRGPTEADSHVMAAIVARAPATLEPGPVVRDELDVPMENRFTEAATNPVGPGADAAGAATEGARDAAKGPSTNPFGPATGAIEAATEGARGPGTNPLGPTANAVEAATSGPTDAATGSGAAGGAGAAIADGLEAAAGGSTTGGAAGAAAGGAGAAVASGLAAAAGGASAGGAAAASGLDGAAVGAAGASATTADSGAAGAGPTVGAASTAAAAGAGAAGPGAVDPVAAGAAGGAGAAGPGAVDPVAAGAPGAAGLAGEAAGPGAAGPAGEAGGPAGAAVAAAGGLADAIAGGGAGGAAGAGAQIGGAITAAMGNVAPALDGAAIAGGPGATPASGAAGGAPDVATGAAGPDGEGAATQEGPSEDELAALESQLNAGPKAAEPEPEASGTEGDDGPEAAAETASAESTDEATATAETATATTEDAGPDESGGLLSRAPADTLTAPPSGEMQNQLDGIESEQAETEQPEDAPADDAAISADAQGELADLGASGGDDMAAAGSGGGGGGGGAVEAQPEPPAPDVSNADPAQAVQAAANLKPAQMLETLGGAEKAASNHVEKEHQKLQAEPPSVTAGGGTDGPAADERFTSSAPNRPTTTKAAEKTGGAPEKPAPTPAPPPKAPLPAGPAVTPDAKGNVGADGAAKIQQSIAALPTADGAVAVPSLAAPRVALTGAADPTQINEQKQHLDQTVAKASAQGAQEAHEPAGEDHLAPTTKAEKIQAEIVGGAPGGAPAGGATTDDDTASIVADQESGPALKAQIAQASGQINQEKQQHAAKSAQDKAAALEQAAAEETKGKADQLAEHAAAKAGVSKARSDWTSEQKQQADNARQEATGHIAEAQTAIQGEKLRADAEASKHVEAGLREANDAKRKGDEDARKEKEKAKEESSGGGFFGWVASKAKALYDKVKDGITNIFNKVRSAITTAINKAKDLAHSVIDKAVKFVADKVKAVAGKLLAIGDRLIPGFATLRQKFKTWIVDRVKQAVAALNRIVTAVKDGIRRVMTAVGNALKQGLDLLKKGISAAINAVKNAVKAAIEKAKAMIATLAQFAVIIKDVAANPGAWIRNLGAAIMDGIKNHLWAALKQAISQWFNDKVESLLGLGKSVWNLLTKGGITMAQVGKMAWEAIKSAIPAALIAILVERLVSMIVPAAGAVMAIIQGLVAAWGAIQRILAAIDRFIAFLKAVKSGNAGPAFAQALAAAAVAVIEFVSQFLLRKIAGAASKVAGKIKAIAQKIGKRLMAAMKKVGKAVKKGYNKLKAKAKKVKEKIFGPKKQKSPEDEKKEKQDKLDKAVREITPKLQALMAKGVGRLRLKAQLAYWKLRYRLTSLEAIGSGHSVTVKAKVNPEADLIRNVILTTGDLLHEQVDKVWEIVIKDPKVQAALQKKREQRSASLQDKSGEQEKKKQKIVGPYSRTEVDDPGVPGVSQLDVLTGSQMADGSKRPAHLIETTNFRDAQGGLAGSASERQEIGGPGSIMVTGGGRYSERTDISGMSLDESKTFGQALLALQSRQPLPAGVDIKKVQEFARLGHVEAGRDKGSFVTIQMLAQLMAQGKVTAGEALLSHQMGDVGAMDIARRAQEQRERQARVRAALEAGETPAKKDEKAPWRGKRKWKEGDEKKEEDWEDATGRFWDREKKAVVMWLETRMLLDPQYFATEQAFTNLLKHEMPEYLAHHIVSGTMLQIPVSRPAPDDPGGAGAAAADILG